MSRRLLTAPFCGTQVLEKLIFRNRPLIIALFVLVSIVLSWQMSGLKVDASFEKMIPLKHPYIMNWLERRDELDSANILRIAVAPQEGDIFNHNYMSRLQELTDEVFYLPGVDRIGMKSLWTPNVRWQEVIEDGFQGGAVIPQNYDGNAASLKMLRMNILRSGVVGHLVANDFQSSIIKIPLFEVNPETGEKLDYVALSTALETLRIRYAEQGIDLHIVGFAKIVGDLFDSMQTIAIFFLMALGITTVLVFAYTRCLRLTVIPVLCSLTAVVWQLGLLSTLGLGLDLYSVLVPFLVFAIGISHGVQIINNIAIESVKGSNILDAARLAFRALCVPGLLALVSDAIGFMTLLVIEVDVIRSLAIAASLGVAVIILTNLILLPVLMSKVGVSRRVYERNSTVKVIPGLNRLAGWCVSPKVVSISIVLALCGFGYGWMMKSQIQIGDLDTGASELRADSRYNMDNAYIMANYSTSADMFITMVETEPEQCANYKSLKAIDDYIWHMQQLPGVQDVVSLVTVAKKTIRALNERNPQWQALSRNQYVLNSAVSSMRASELYNQDCSLVPVLLFLEDHKADTLARVVSATEDFAAANNTDDIRFLMATGNAGIKAATNEVIASSQNLMLLCVYFVVSIMCLITFRSICAVICIIVPLALTSLLCQALMVHMGIGLHISTLPVIALGIGIGVDYGIYIYSRLERFLKQGMSLEKAYCETLRTTGKAVLLTGMTLAIGVCSWIFSPVKFQADMGILLTFMFLWNIFGAIWLLPALVYFFVHPDDLKQQDSSSSYK